MVIRNDIRKEVETFLMELENKGVHVEKSYLFGSYAKGEEHEFSDIDLALISQNFNGILHEDIKPFLDLLAKHYRIQPVTFHPRKLKEGGPLIEEIMKTGIVIDTVKK
jgi:predicted nucleotidyltransferase